MRRRRKRARWRFRAGLLWLLLVGNVAAGIVFSPISAPTKALVFGVTGAAKQDVDAVLKGLENQPWARIDARQVETRLQDVPEIAAADVRGNILGRISVKVTMRVPVAKYGNRDVALSDDGYLYAGRQDVSHLPTLWLPEGVNTASLGLCGVWHAADVAKLCERLPTLDPKARWDVAVTPEGRLYFKKDRAVSVVLGSPDDLDLKLQRFAQLIRERPQLLATSREVNLTAPDHPTSVPNRP